MYRPPQEATMTDRYLKIVLTVIALELGWIGVNQMMPRAEAQQNAATPVVIRGIDLRGAPASAALPIAIVGAYRQIPNELQRQLERPQVTIANTVDVRAIAPVKVEADRPIKIAADTVLRVENVGYTPAQKPGE
jgi:hypothetical protein